jgi:hypothetical protein
VPHADRWLLHAGDAYFHHREITADPPVSHPWFDIIQNGAEVDRGARLAARDRLRALHREHGDEIDVFSAHDPWEFHRFS